MKIRPIRTPQELDAVHECAKQDGHHLAWPSHSIMKGEYIVGALSVMPMTLVWLDSKQVKVRETIETDKFIEGMLVNTTRSLCVPCISTSPMFLLMDKLGYLNLGQSTIFIKGL